MDITFFFNLVYYKKFQCGKRETLIGCWFINLISILVQYFMTTLLLYMCWKFFVMRYGLHVQFHLIHINSLTHPFLNVCWLKSFNLINQTFGVFIDNIVIISQIREVIPSFPTSIEEIHRSKSNYVAVCYGFIWAIVIK